MNWQVTLNGKVIASGEGNLRLAWETIKASKKPGVYKIYINNKEAGVMTKRRA